MTDEARIRARIVWAMAALPLVALRLLAEIADALADAQRGGDREP